MNFPIQFKAQQPFHFADAKQNRTLGSCERVLVYDQRDLPLFVNFQYRLGQRVAWRECRIPIKIKGNLVLNRRRSLILDNLQKELIDSGYYKMDGKYPKAVG